MATPITTTTVPEPDNSKGLYKIGQSFVVGKDTVNAKGIVGIPDNVCVDGDLYLKDKTVGGIGHIILNAETVKNLDDTVQSNKNRLDSLFDGSTTAIDTITEIVAAFDAGDSSLQTLVTGLTSAQTINTTQISTNVDSIATNAASIITNASDIGTNGLLIQGLSSLSDTNKIQIDANVASITSINSTLTAASNNNTDITNIKTIVPAPDGVYGGMVPSPAPQTLVGVGALGPLTPVNILLHLGPIWKLVCIDNNANHITYLQLKDPLTDGAILGDYERTTAVELSAFYTLP